MCNCDFAYIFLAASTDADTNKSQKRKEIKMILADKIINERKKNGWSQEELAEKLSVSRQSVSKWEGAQAVPDLQKIINMADIFGVTTDYLLKDELEPELHLSTSDIAVSESVSEPPARKVSLNEANTYMELVKKIAPKIANGVSLCIISPIILIFLAGLSDAEQGITEGVAAGVGMLFLFACIATAVYTFITTNAKEKPYEYLSYEAIDTEYGVTGIVKEKKEAFKERHTRTIAFAVIMCVVCAVPLIVAGVINAPEMILVSMVDLLLIIIATAVNMMIRSGSVMDSYNKLLEEEEFVVSKKLIAKKVERVSGLFWSATVAIYLAISLPTGRWEYTWVIWPVAALLHAALKHAMSIKYGEDL